jgi:hypothetical protein
MTTITEETKNSNNKRSYEKVAEPDTALFIWITAIKVKFPAQTDILDSHPLSITR